MNSVDLFDGRRAQDFAQYRFTRNHQVAAQRPMLFEIGLQPPFRGFLSPAGIGAGGHSEISEIVNRKVGQ